MSNDLEPKIYFPLTGSTQHDDLLPVTVVRFECYPGKFINLAVNIDDMLRQIYEKYPNEFETMIQKIGVINNAKEI